MRPEESKPEREPSDLADLPRKEAVDASADADKVKGGVTSPRDPATGLPTGKRS